MGREVGYPELDASTSNDAWMDERVGSAASDDVAARPAAYDPR